MNGRERFQAALEGIPPDIVPMIPGNNNAFLCHYYKATVQQLLDTPERYAELNVRFTADFGFDMVRPNVGYIFYGCGPELGVVWKFVEQDFPGAVAGCIDTEADLNRFRIPEEPSGYFKKYLDIYRILTKEIGDKTYIRGAALGPFSSACFLRGLQDFLLDSAVNLDLFHQVMQKSVALSNYFVEQVSSTGVHDMVLNEVYLTPGNLSPLSFEQNVKPYIHKVLGSHPSIALSFYQQDFVDVGDLPDGTSKKGLASVIYYGTKEDPDVIRQCLSLPIPGHPPLVSVSGRSLVQRDIHDILEFIRKGVDIILELGARNPCIYLVSVQAANSVEAQAISKKMHRIREFRENLRL